MAPRADRPDAELATAARAGDREALGALLDRHLDRLHAVCRRICGPADALDATQEALIAIARSIDRFDGRAAFTTWAHRIAVNAALDELRRARRRGIPASDLLDRTDPPAPEGHGPDRVVDRMVLDDALAALPDEYRTAVVLRDVADLEYAEIAAVLEVPIGTVRSRIARGRAALADALGNRDTTSTVQANDHA
jgi:RNA polymerase sigma-70 factor (ECF subfamily)